MAKQVAEPIPQPTEGKTPLCVPEADAGQRLERWLRTQFPSRTFGEVQKGCRTGQVRVNGKRVKGPEKIAAGDDVRVPPFWHQKIEKTSEKFAGKTSAETRRFIQEHIIFEDKHMIVFNKPAGLPAQAGTGHENSVDRLLARYVGQPVKLVHRLDKVTSGLILVGKTREAAAALTQQFKFRSADKRYLAVVDGPLPRLEGEIDAPLLKAGNRSVVHPEGQDARTAYKVLDAADAGLALLEVKLLTGRMHQIRAHMAALEVVIVGDKLYGWNAPWPDGMAPKKTAHGQGDHIMLHAWTLSLEHPKTGQEMTFEAPLPTYFPPLPKD